MNETLQSPVIGNEKRWYCLSVFYAREYWDTLISEILRFYQERQNQFSDCLLTFSKEKGEHIQVVFTASGNSKNNYSNEIETYFQTFVDQNPSVSQTPFPYGQAVWCNYPNNSLTWYKLRLPDYSEQYICFHQRTIEVSLNLLAGDFSEDTFFSLGIYLLTKALCLIDRTEQKDALSQALRDASVGFPHFVYAAKELMSEIDIKEIGEAIESYLNENDDEHSAELTAWLKEVKDLLKQNSYNRLCTFICEITGLKGLRHLMILELMNNRFNSRQDEDRR